MEPPGGTTPRSIALAREAAPRLPAGDEDGDRFAGYGATGVRFQSGHLVGFWRSPASSLGAAHALVWLRAPGNEWAFYVDVPPELSLARYLHPAGRVVAVGTITFSWLGHHSLSIQIPEARLAWALHFGSTRATRALSSILPHLPRAAWRSRRVAAALARAGAPALRVGRLALGGRLPAGGTLHVHPERLWKVDGASARLHAVHLGAPTPAPVQVRLGDLPIPRLALLLEGWLEMRDTQPEARRRRVSTSFPTLSGSADREPSLSRPSASAARVPRRAEP
jgi:hypothetical protein